MIVSQKKIIAHLVKIDNAAKKAIKCEDLEEMRSRLEDIQKLMDEVISEECELKKEFILEEEEIDDVVKEIILKTAELGDIIKKL